MVPYAPSHPRTVPPPLLQEMMISSSLSLVIHSHPTPSLPWKIRRVGRKLEVPFQVIVARNAQRELPNRKIHQRKVYHSSSSCFIPHGHFVVAERQWVPVPTGLRSNAGGNSTHRSNPRNRSQSRTNNTSANTSSGSGEISQRSSRPHSVHNSASHSRVSSRTGSIHASPRFNPANRTLYDTPQIPPSVSYPEVLHSPRYLRPNPAIDNSMNNPYMYSYSPVEGSSTSVFKRLHPCLNIRSHGVLIPRFSVTTLLLL